MSRLATTLRKRTDDIVSLVASDLQNRNTHSLEKALDVWHRELDILGCWGAVSLILRENITTEAASRRIERHAKHIGLLTLKDIAQELRKAKDNRGVYAITVTHRASHKGVVVLEYQRISVD